MERKGAANCDPGWNDPPLFSYDSHIAQLKSSKSRTLLNKRVAFPLHEASPTTANHVPVDPTAPLSSCNISNLPPPPSGLFSPPKIPVPDIEKEESKEAFNPIQALETVLNNFSEVLSVKFEAGDKDKAEIKRRLDTMEKVWLENKLSGDIQAKLLQLSEALKSEDIEKADNLQKGLMVDHAAACSQWMSGVRHLIHHHEREQPSSLSENEEGNQE